MITDTAKAKGTFYRGGWLIPVNVCSHCGEDDDPETTAKWPKDSDDDRICPTCNEKDNDDDNN